MNREEFIKYIQELGLNPTEKQLNQLEIYAGFLLEYNKTTNLTAIKDLDGVYLKHFYDSLTILKAIDLNTIDNMIDIGSGAGFPGMVIKIMFPHIKVTLLDSNNKKTTFLTKLITKLELKDIEVINARSEEYAHTNLDSFDLVTARAVSEMAILTELSLPLVKVGGYFVPLKSTIESELTRAEAIIEILGGKIENIFAFTLPKEDSLRNIIKIKKINETPKGYPRSYDKIKKSLKKSQK